MIRSKVWLIALSVIGMGLAACDKEETMSPGSSAVTSSSGGTNDNNTGNNGSSAGSGSVGQNNGDQVGRSTLAETVIRGAYMVSNATLNTDDVTARFDGIKFTFNEGGGVSIEGTGINIKGGYRIDSRTLYMFVDGTADGHPELLQTKWGLNDMNAGSLMISTPYMNGPRYIITLERVDQ